MSRDINALVERVMKGYVAQARPLDQMFTVGGKVAIVTGGTSGLGFCTALRLLQGGAKVVVSSHSEAEAERAMGLFREAGFDQAVSFCKADVTSEAEVEALVDYTAETYGTIDILVTAAAIFSYAHVYDLPDEVFARTVDVNLNGAFRAAKFVSRYMVDHGVKGKITFISSNCAWLPRPLFGGYPHYASSKGGLIALAVELAKELKRYDIQVNSVAPGAMGTPGGIVMAPEKNLTQQQKDELQAELGALNKMDRVLPVDAVAIVVYMMCTPVSDGMTGECIVADDGMAHNIVTRQTPAAEYPPPAE